MSKEFYIPAPQPVRPLCSGNRKGAGAPLRNRNAERHGFFNRERRAHRAYVKALRAQLKLSVRWAMIFVHAYRRAGSDQRRRWIIDRHKDHVADLLRVRLNHLTAMEGEGAGIQKTIMLRRQRRRAV